LTLLLLLTCFCFASAFALTLPCFCFNSAFALTLLLL
jgi:hypothetical protein